MQIVESLTEALLPDAMRQQVYYHGTSQDVRGRNILEHGIQPGNQGTASRGHLTPVVGRSYITTRLEYGVIYCIGGNMLGCSPESAQRLVDKVNRGETASQYGWLFVINGDTLVNDIQPDEDSVGEAAMYADIILNHPEKSHYYAHDLLFQGLLRANQQWLRYFHHNARSSMTDRQWREALDGMIAAQAAGGKRFLKRMNDADKLNLIRAGAHISYAGPIIPDQAWRFDKLKTCDLEKDGSNFFALAERVR